MSLKQTKRKGLQQRARDILGVNAPSLAELVNLACAKLGEDPTWETKAQGYAVLLRLTIMFPVTTLAIESPGRQLLVRTSPASPHLPSLEEQSTVRPVRYVTPVDLILEADEVDAAKSRAVRLRRDRAFWTERFVNG